MFKNTVRVLRDYTGLIITSYLLLASLAFFPLLTSADDSPCGQRYGCSGVSSNPDSCTKLDVPPRRLPAIPSPYDRKHNVVPEKVVEIQKLLKPYCILIDHLACQRDNYKNAKKGPARIKLFNCLADNLANVAGHNFMESGKGSTYQYQYLLQEMAKVINSVKTELKNGESKDISDIKEWTEDLCDKINGDPRIGSNNVGQLAKKNCAKIAQINNNKKIYKKLEKDLATSLKNVVTDRGVTYFAGDLSRCRRIPQYTYSSLVALRDQASLIKRNGGYNFYSSSVENGVLCKIIDSYNDSAAGDFYQRERKKRDCNDMNHSLESKPRLSSACH